MKINKPPCGSKEHRSETDCEVLSSLNHCFSLSKHETHLEQEFSTSPSCKPKEIGKLCGSSKTCLFVFSGAWILQYTLGLKHLLQLSVFFSYSTDNKYVMEQIFLTSRHIRKNIRFRRHTAAHLKTRHEWEKWVHLWMQLLFVLLQVYLYLLEMLSLSPVFTLHS